MIFVTGAGWPESTQLPVSGVRSGQGGMFRCLVKLACIGHRIIQDSSLWWSVPFQPRRPWRGKPSTSGEGARREDLAILGSFGIGSFAELGTNLVPDVSTSWPWPGCRSESSGKIGHNNRCWDWWRPTHTGTVSAQSTAHVVVFSRKGMRVLSLSRLNKLQYGRSVRGKLLYYSYKKWFSLLLICFPRSLPYNTLVLGGKGIP